MDTSDAFGDKPRDINIVEFVQERALEIADLMSAVDNRELPAREVAQGPRTFIQRQPRHMRRRAMSYNVKRLPKRARQGVDAFIGAHKHRKKPPSRCYRRRASNLLNAYCRRQRKVRWLETHIWHAKRFHTTEIAGWKLPYRSCQRGFRAGYRDAVRHCVVEDISYYCCVQLDGSENVLLEKLNLICSPKVGLTFKGLLYLDGNTEGSVVLYEPYSYPRKCLGTASFMWKSRDATENKTRSLWIWCYPSLKENLLNCLTNLFKMKKISSSYSGSTELYSNLDKYIADKSVHSLQYNSLEFDVKLTVLDDNLLRFRLTGPKSTAILNEILQKPNPNIDSSSSPLLLSKLDSNFEESWHAWSNVYGRLEPGRVTPGVIISLLVEDPRIKLDFKKKLPTNNGNYVKSDVLPVKHQISGSPLWTHEIRQHVLSSKIKDSEINKKRNQLNLAAGKPLDASLMMSDVNSVPILLVHQRGALSGSGLSANFGSGWDMILPSGWGMPFWLALQYRAAHAGGIRTRQKLNFEIGRLEFPTFFPDTSAGVDYAADATKQLVDKYLLRPPNRRRKYSSLKIKYPFSVNWLELINGWTKNDLASEFYVLRERTVLKWLRDSLGEPADRNDRSLWRDHSHSLVPVKIVSLGKGTPAPFSLICLPTDQDLITIDKLNLLEEKRDKQVRCKQSASSASDAKIATMLEEDFLSFEKPTAGVRFDLDKFFADKFQQKVAKRKSNEKLRKRRKKCKVLDDAVEPERHKIDSHVNVVDSCSRKIAGFVVWGDYSFAIGRGVGYGFCSLAGLEEFSKLSGVQKNLHKASLLTRALFRNTNSRLYRGCSLEIVIA